jgi:hypothetical protein
VTINKLSKYSAPENYLPTISLDKSQNTILDSYRSVSNAFKESEDTPIKNFAREFTVKTMSGVKLINSQSVSSIQIN